jgi:riboflavin kinase/FMN adenylyltransferase
MLNLAALAMIALMQTPCVITIGNFDGVHKGHQAIFCRAKQLAQSAGLKLTALTFDPHPATVLRPSSVPPRLMTLEDKCNALVTAGVDDVVVLEPTGELLARTPGDFIEHLCEEYRPVAIVEGHDFRFGRDRQGDMNQLRELGQAGGVSGRGFDVHEVETVELALANLQLAPVRSSLIRWLIGVGRVGDASVCLGQPYQLTGTVEQGEQRGSSIGIPTANLDPDKLAGMMVPGDGVYGGEAILPDGSSHKAAISVGIKPTFGKNRLTIEAHLLDFVGDLYGQSLTLRFTRWLRDQQRFPSIDTLKTQLHRDIADVRQGFNLQSKLKSAI